MLENLLNDLSKSDILESIYECHSDAIFIISSSPERNIVDCNDAAARLFGFDREELIGKSIDIVHTDDAASGEVEEIFFPKTVKKGFFHLDKFKMKRKDSSIFFSELSVMPLFSATGEHQGWVSMVRDISEKCKVEEDLSIERTRLSAHLNAASITLITLDKDGRIDFVNSYGRALLDLDDSDVRDRNWFDEFVPAGKEEETISLFYKLLLDRDRNGKYFVHIIDTPKGRQKTIGWYAAVYYDESDAFSGFILRGVEITKNEEFAVRMIKSNESLRKLNSRLHKRREDKMAGLTRKIMDDMGQVATGLSFDVSMLEKMLWKDDFNSKRIEMSNKLKEAGETLNYLIQFGRDLSSGIRPTSLDDIGLPATLKWFAGDFQKKTGIICSAQHISSSVLVEKDSSIILFRVCEEIFENIKNHSRANRVDILLEEKDGRLNLSIKDNGVGISRGDISNPASLGLLRIKENVRDISGTVVINGEKSTGTTITISIPIKK
ncbi:MAG: PAS domain S-box protein [Spirochaetales bacterium]|nr:PAS domain S-box protein [Spirochaetales bacterium]